MIYYIVEIFKGGILCFHHLFHYSIPEYWEFFIIIYSKGEIYW